MYIPKNKYIVRSAKPGEFIDNYSGLVIETSKGEFFQGDSLEGIPNKLTKASNTLPASVDLKPFHEYIRPTEEDYEKGFFIRYIFMNNLTKRIVEVSKEQFNKKNNFSGFLRANFVWYIKGAIKDSFIGTTRIPGVESSNKLTLSNLKVDFPTIEELFNNPLEFHKR